MCIYPSIYMYMYVNALHMYIYIYIYIYAYLFTRIAHLPGRRLWLHVHVHGNTQKAQRRNEAFGAIPGGRYGMPKLWSCDAYVTRHTRIACVYIYIYIYNIYCMRSRLSLASAATRQTCSCCLSNKPCTAIPARIRLLTWSMRNVLKTLAGNHLTKRGK